MLYREIIAICSEIHTKHVNTLLPAFWVQVLIWKGDSGSTPERAHRDKFLWL